MLRSFHPHGHFCGRVLCSTGGGSTNAVLVGKIPFVLQSDYVMAACLLAYLAVFASPGDIVFRILSWKPLSVRASFSLLCGGNLQSEHHDTPRPLLALM